MMQLKCIGHVLLRVRNLERSRTFYTTILGFEDVPLEFER